MEFLVNPDEDDPVKVAAVIEFWTGQKTDNGNPEQQKIVQEPICSECQEKKQ